MLFASRLRTFCGAIVLGLGALRLASGQTCAVSTNVDYEFEVDADTGFTVFWNTPTETSVDFLVEYTGEAWIGLGFSVDGEMTGSDAVIGIPPADTAVEYDLNGRNLRSVVVSDLQEVTATLVSQEDGVTSMAFTRPLAPTGTDKEILSTTADNFILWAYGFDNTLDPHAGRGFFSLDLAGCADAVDATPSPTAEATTPLPTTPSPTDAGATLAPGSTPAPTAAAADTGTFECSTDVSSGDVFATISWTVDDTAGTVSFMMEVNIEAWVSVGFSEDGKMVVADAVIGLPDEGNAFEHDLLDYSLDAVTRSEEEEISDQSVSFDGTSTILTFTRPLAPTGDKVTLTSSGVSQLIWAVGTDNTLAYHFSTRGQLEDVVLDCTLDDGTDTGTGTDTDDETETDDEGDPTDVGAAGIDCTSDDDNYDFQLAVTDSYTLYWSVVDGEAGRSVSARIVYAGEAWVALGFSASGDMVPADAVIGTGDGVAEYELSAYALPSAFADQELDAGATGAYDSATDTTEMMFVRPLAPASTSKLELSETETVTLIWAHGSGSQTLTQHTLSNRGALSLNLATCSASFIEDDLDLEYSHAWLMTLAWGFMIPVGVMTARFGKPEGLSWWLNVHRALNTLGVLASLAGFFIAVSFVDDRGSDLHFKINHARAGLAVVCAGVVQAVNGVLRPHAPGQGETRSGIRLAWEIMHKFLGRGAVLLAVYVVLTGMDELDLADKWRTAYLTIICILAAIFFILQLRACLTGGKTPIVRDGPGKQVTGAEGTSPIHAAPMSAQVSTGGVQMGTLPQGNTQGYSYE